MIRTVGDGLMVSEPTRPRTWADPVRTSRPAADERPFLAGVGAVTAAVPGHLSGGVVVLVFGAVAAVTDAPTVRALIPRRSG